MNNHVASGDSSSLPPKTLRELGPERTHLFVPMHRGAALRCQQEGLLLSTRELLSHSDHVPLGDPRLVRSRLAARMPEPWPGRLGDYVSFTFTPRTPAALGSCGAKTAPGAKRLRPGDLVVASIPLDRLVSSGIPIGFSDRNPVVRNAEIERKPNTDLVPWSLIRTSRFGGPDIDPADKARYNCEVLAWGCVPLELGVTFAVVDEHTAHEVFLSNTPGRGAALPLVRPAYFFGL